MPEDTQKELTLEQAFNNIALAVSQYRGTRAEHVALEQSLGTIRSALPAPEVKADSEKSTG